jgi:phosphatidylserine/phosphatidylglycerophosphate/cardiolipin synthase-like enzyme
VLTGSANWTSTGLGCQSNNVVVIDDPATAASYLDYWQRLRAESSAARATQSAAFRQTNQQPHTSAVDGGTVTVRLSPNTARQTKPTTDPPRPVDLVEVFDLIAGAKRGVIFLLFQPGRPSVVDAMLDAQAANPDLFVRGAATDRDAMGDYSTDLFHGTGSVAHVAAASAINDDFAFWQKELLLDVYDHYRWRYTLQSQGRRAWSGLSKSDKWQGKYFSGVIREEFRFFGGG